MTDDEAVLVERLGDTCQFLRSCRPKADDDSAVWLTLGDLEALLDIAERVGGTQ